MDRLLRPASIAVIGGGPWCEAVIAQNLKIGFKGLIWPVHPHRDTVAGLPAYRALADLPAAPDAAFIGVNRQATIDVVGALQKMGAGGAVCFASGFLEAEDGAALHDALLAAAADMPILGPNCYGLLNAVDLVTLWPDEHGLAPVCAGVAIVAQSSNIAINLTMQRRGLPIAFVVTPGNQAQLSIAQIAMALLHDPRVTALGLYIESFRDIAAFEQLAALSAALGKPIVAIKAGQSEAARRATLSHTASLAGSGAGADALMARLGIASVSSLAVMLEVLKIFHCFGPLPGRAIASLSCSGGEASVMADTAARHGLTLPDLHDTQMNLLAQHLSPLVTITNPLDYHTDIWRNRSAMAAVFAAMATDTTDLTVILLDFPDPQKCALDDWMITVDAIEDAAKQGGRFAVLASLPENMPEDIATRLITAGIVPLCDIDQACAAIAAAAIPGQPAQLPVLTAPDYAKTNVIAEAEAKAVLSDAGLDVPIGQGGLTAHDLAQKANNFSYPVVLKGEGRAHKSEAGAVVLNIPDKAALRAAAAKMDAESFLVEEMIQGSIAELLVGIVADPVHGFVLTLGAGGVLAELMSDQQCLLLPTHETAIREALNSLPIAAILHGYRGAARVNLEAIADAVIQLQNFAVAHATTIVEVEVNPLICTATRAIVADALLVKGRP